MKESGESREPRESGESIDSNHSTLPTLPILSTPPKNRHLFTVAYDGVGFEGWQSQRGGNTVQDIIEAAFERLVKQPVRIHGAGRTDAGVHALAQRFHADTPVSLRMDAATWVKALNSTLPPTIRILAARRMTPDFHARFSAKKKTYRYLIRNADILPPHEAGRAWLVPQALPLAALHEAAEIFIGTHDFTAFSAKRDRSKSPPPELPPDNRRTIDSIRVSQRGTLIRIEFTGNGFLYKMVRMLTAAIERHAQGRVTLEELRTFLDKSPGPLPTRWNHTAPADGLYLEKISYL